VGQCGASGAACERHTKTKTTRQWALRAKAVMHRATPDLGSGEEAQLRGKGLPSYLPAVKLRWIAKAECIFSRCEDGAAGREPIAKPKRPTPMGPLSAETVSATPTMFVQMPCRAMGHNEQCTVPSRPQRGGAGLAPARLVTCVYSRKPRWTRCQARRARHALDVKARVA
jgi:hypothetical protein